MDTPRSTYDAPSERKSMQDRRTFGEEIVGVDLHARETIDECEYAGIYVHTNLQTIKCLISEQSGCCEVFGVSAVIQGEGMILKEETVGAIIGKKLVRIRYVHQNLDATGTLAVHADQFSAPIQLEFEKGPPLLVIIHNVHGGITVTRTSSSMVLGRTMTVCNIVISWSFNSGT
jgi:hypothetical protein